MLRSYLLTLYRSLVKHRLFSALNILGLAVGMAVFLVLTIATQWELSYDRWIPQAERTFRVSGVMNIPGRPKDTISVIPGPVLPNLRADFGDIEASVRLLSTSMPVRRGQQGAFEDMIFADPTFFDVFDLPLAAGRKEQALADTASLVISETMARKYFGHTKVIGERLTVTTDGTDRDYRVAAVLKDLPENTHLKADLIARLDKSVLPNTAEYLDQWNATNYMTYVRLPNAAAAESVQSRLGGFLQTRSPDLAAWFSLTLEPLTQIHFNTTPLVSFKPGADRRFITMLQVVGFLTLLMAVINYVNLSTARAALRAREVALRKVFGGTRGALLLQFLVEAVVVSLIAGLIAVALVELSLPLVNTALGAPLKLNYLGPDSVLPLFVGITVLVGLAAGVYPALVISRFEPAGVLAASRAPGGGRAAAIVREILVVAQFAVSIALLICTGVVLAQSDFVRKADLGFQRQQLMLVKQLTSAGAGDQRNVIIDAFRRTPGVEAVTISSRYPGRGGVGRSSDFNRPGMQARAANLAFEPIGEQYFETLGLRMAAGRAFNRANRLDDAAGLDLGEATKRGLNVVINETAARGLEFKRPSDAVNQIIREGGVQDYRVVGVVQDARYGSPRDPVPPLLYVLDTSTKPQLDGNPSVIVRFRGEPEAMRQRLETVWRGIVPNAPFESETAEAALGAFYEPEEQRGRLVTLGAIVAAVIGCLGLYGLAAFASERRTREIGVRKVLGASTSDVFRLLVGQFLRPVVIANVVAWPVAFLLMREWLNSFDQRIDLSPLYFAGATVLALAVALVTVTGQAMKVARADPGQALRDE